MSSIRFAAARDYNSTIAAIAHESAHNDIDTIVSCVKCGVGLRATVEREVVNSNVKALKPILENHYVADGRATPLFDSVGELIEMFENVPDVNDPTVSFLIMAISDGAENSSQRWKTKLPAKMRALQNTDRWTFVWRVPRGDARNLMHLGIPEGNIQEWEQTQRGFETATAQTRAAWSDYYAGRKSGKTSTTRFYADLSAVPLTEVKASLTDISRETKLFAVPTVEDGISIKDFSERHVANWLGRMFYQLSKAETVQERKQIVIREKASGAVYGGQNARAMLALPSYGSAKIKPGDLGIYDVFIQSTSTNRKLVGGTNVLYWPSA